MNGKLSNTRRAFALFAMVLFAAVGLASTASASVGDIEFRAVNSGSCKGSTYSTDTYYNCLGIWSGGGLDEGFCVGEYEETKEDEPGEGTCHGIEYHPLTDLLFG